MASGIRELLAELAAFLALPALAALTTIFTLWGDIHGILYVTGCLLTVWVAPFVALFVIGAILAAISHTFKVLAGRF